jgi:hypothetical protein
MPGMMVLADAWWNQTNTRPNYVPSAGFAGAILVVGEASEGAVEAPSEL